MGAGPPTNQITNQEDKFIKTAIIYCSRHQGNTKKLIDAITSQYPVELFNVNELKDNIDWAAYDVVGIASGVFMEKFYKPILKYAERFMPNGQRIFILFTSGAPGAARFKKLQEIADAKNAHILGVYGCRGYYNFFPVSLVGGRRQGHPNQEEISGAVTFYADLCRQFAENDFHYQQIIHTKI